MTSSSEVCVKWRYPCPTAKKNAGVFRQTTSSAYPANLATMSSGPIGTANTTLLAPCARATWHAALAVAPVAMPSSTIRAIRPVNGIRSRPRRKRSARRRSSIRSLAFDSVHVVAVELCLAHDCVVEYPHAVLADGAEGQFGLKRHTELAHDKHVERGPQCFGDLKCHRHAAAWQAENDDVLTIEEMRDAAPTGAQRRHDRQTVSSPEC